MGLARVRNSTAEMKIGDVLVWEYPLLDILMEGFYGDELLLIMREAWIAARRRGAKVVIAFTQPRAHIERDPVPLEAAICRLAGKMSIPVVSVRDSFAALRLEAAEEYMDDRHIRPGSPVHDHYGERIVQEIERRQFRLIWPAERLYRDRWQWQPASACGYTAETLTNSLMSVEVVRMKAGMPVHLPASARVVAVVATTTQTGAIWCGHRYCAGVAARKVESKLPMLLQIARIPCVRPPVTTLYRTAPAYEPSIFLDHGGAHEPRTDGDVLLHGVLFMRA